MEMSLRELQDGAGLAHVPRAHLLKIVSIQFQIVTPLSDRTMEKAGPRIFNFISSY